MDKNDKKVVQYLVLRDILVNMNREDILILVEEVFADEDLESIFVNQYLERIFMDLHRDDILILVEEIFADQDLESIFVNQDLERIFMDLQ